MTRCRYCGRETEVPCRNTRDMDPVDGFNRDPGCNRALSDLGGGERRYVQPESERPKVLH